MAADAIILDKNHDIIRTAIRGIQMIREGAWNISNSLMSMTALKDEAGSDAAHFDLLATQCSIQAGDYASANAAAKQLFDELNSVSGNLSAGLAAAEQLCGFLGV